MAKSKGHTIQWPKVKDTQYNGQNKRHAIQWPKVKDTQYNGQK